MAKLKKKGSKVQGHSCTFVSNTVPTFVNLLLFTLFHAYNIMTQTVCYSMQLKTADDCTFFEMTVFNNTISNHLKGLSALLRQILSN